MSGFGKVFAGLYEGSMLGAGVHVFALWPYCIARSDAHGNVEVNPRLAAVVLGCSIPEVESALDYLQRPDPESRSKEEEGRRLIREGQFAYRIVNYLQYREIRDAEARRERQREWDRVHRPSGHARTTQSDTVRHGPTNPTQAEAEAEAEAEKREARGSAPRAPSPLSRLVATWESERGALPAVRGMSKARDRKAKARLTDVPDLDRWAAAFRRAAVSPFCLGENDRGWRASFDWFLQPDTLLKVEEGKYDRAPRAGRPAPTLIGSHPPGPKLREIDEDSPEEIVEIVSRLRRREATDAEIATLDAWQRGA